MEPHHVPLFTLANLKLSSENVHQVINCIGDIMDGIQPNDDDLKVLRGEIHNGFCDTYDEQVFDEWLEQRNLTPKKPVKTC